MLMLTVTDLYRKNIKPSRSKWRNFSRDWEVVVVIRRDPRVGRKSKSIDNAIGLIWAQELIVR